MTRAGDDDGLSRVIGSANLVTAAVEAPRKGFRPFTREDGLRGSARAAEVRRERAAELEQLRALVGGSLTQQQSSLNTQSSLSDLQSRLVRSMAQLHARCQASLDARDARFTPAEHRALASTLIALSERVDAAIAAERAVGQGAVESYEQRLARAYAEAGLPIPGRLAAQARGRMASSIAGLETGETTPTGASGPDPDPEDPPPQLPEFGMPGHGG